MDDYIKLFYAKNWIEFFFFLLLKKFIFMYCNFPRFLLQRKAAVAFCVILLPTKPISHLLQITIPIVLTESSRLDNPAGALTHCNSIPYLSVYPQPWRCSSVAPPSSHALTFGSLRSFISSPASPKFPVSINYLLLNLFASLLAALNRKINIVSTSHVKSQFSAFLG